MGTRKKVEKRKKRLEEKVKEGKAFCRFHNQYLTIREMYRKKCYLRRHGKGYCPHVEIYNGKRNDR